MQMKCLPSISICRNWYQIQNNNSTVCYFKDLRPMRWSNYETCLRLTWNAPHCHILCVDLCVIMPNMLLVYDFFFSFCIIKLNVKCYTHSVMNFKGGLTRKKRRFNCLKLPKYFKETFESYVWNVIVYNMLFLRYCYFLLFLSQILNASLMLTANVLTDKNNSIQCWPIAGVVVVLAHKYVSE